jgi:hypothetical protein
MKFIFKQVATLSICIFFLLPAHVQSQLINSGSVITVQSNALIYCDDAFTNTSNGIITNHGSIITNASLINDADASLEGNGLYSLRQNFTNTGTFNQDSSTLEFFGDSNSVIKNKSGKIYILKVNKNANYLVNLIDKEKVLNSVIFSNDKNWIKINNNTLVLDKKASVVGYSKKRYFLTNGTGAIKKLHIKNSPFIFPVGFDRNTYNPLTITENGTPDDYSVRCLDNAFLQGSSGDTISTKGINVSWFIAEAKTGGANAVIDATWKTTDELPNFNYTHCMVVRYNGTKWNFVSDQAGIASGSPYRTISKSGFKNFGYFTVLSGGNPTFTNSISSFEGDAMFSTKMNSIKVYPTIVQNNLHIDVPANNKSVQKMNITITDVNGRTVWQKQNADFISQQITLPNLTQGMYNVLINYNDKQFVQKIIISR